MDTIMRRRLHRQNTMRREVKNLNILRECKEAGAPEGSHGHGHRMGESGDQGRPRNQRAVSLRQGIKPIKMSSKQVPRV